MRRPFRSLAACLAPLAIAGLAAGCGSRGDALDQGAAPDAGAPDAGAPDAGAPADGGPETEVDAGEPECPGASDPGLGLARTESGVAAGVDVGGVWAFRGVPFAAPPVGELRFRRPEPPGCFDGVLDASAYGPSCPQYGREDGRPLTGDEDCLQLNVWSGDLAPDAPAPVLVWIHGGAHEQGSATLPNYAGRRLAEATGAVVVTVNYRLGPFGFLAHPALTAEGAEAASGNYGMHDQLEALRWVQRNVAGFGGDPGRVMIFGQSAGAVSVCRLLVSPLAEGLVHAAAMMSGGCPARPLAAAEESGVTLVEAMGCGDAEDVPACLRALPMETVMESFAPADDGTSTLGRLTFDGTIDGFAVPDAPLTLIDAGEHLQVPLLIGSTLEEAGNNTPNFQTEAQVRAFLRNFFGGSGAFVEDLIDGALEVYPVERYGDSWRRVAIAIASDVKFTCTARNVGRRFAASQDAPVHRYLFTQVPGNAGAGLQAAGAFHGLDTFYVFGTLRDLPFGATGDDDAVIDTMLARWGALADGSAPDDGDLAWPALTDGRDDALILGTPLGLDPDPRADECDFWLEAASGG